MSVLWRTYYPPRERLLSISGWLYVGTAAVFFTLGALLAWAMP